MKRILCYGDSNTWGYIAGTDHLRYNSNERWTKLLQKNLGQDFEIIEEGLNSRTLCSFDKRPGKEFCNGFEYLKPCLNSHDKLDFIVIMLGTNELKHAFNNTPKDILDMVKRYVHYITNFKSQIDKTRPEIVFCGIPLAQENADFCKEENKFKGATEKSVEFNKLLEEYCLENSLIYVNNQDLSVGIDGIHLTKESHAKLANRLTELFTANFN